MVRPDILCLTETHITTEVTDHELNLKNYNILRTDSNSTRTRGVLTYIKKNIYFKQIIIDKLEGTWINIIQVKGKNGFILCNLYRSPSSNISRFCYNIIKMTEYLVERNSKLLLVGDFNIDVNRRQGYSKKLINDFELLGFKQRVGKPIRITSNSETIIDLAVSNFSLKTAVLNTPKFSDHNIVFCEISRQNKDICDFKSKVKTIRDYRSFDIDNFKCKLACSLDKVNIDREVVDVNDFNLIVNEIINIIQDSFNQCAPLRKKIIREQWSYKPWIDTAAKTAIKKRDQLFFKARESNLYSDLQDYKKQRNTVVNLIKKNKREYYDKDIDNKKHEPKKMWKSLKKLIGGKKSELTEMKEIDLYGVILNENKEIANSLNKFFINNVNNIVDNIGCNVINVINTDNYNIRIDEFERVTYSQLNKIIGHFDSNKGSNNDINARIIKLTWDTDSSILLYLINKSLEMGFVPEKWKISTVIPIKKVKLSNKADDLRPINTLPVYEQILERIVKEVLEKYLTENNVLDQNQSGFVKKHSCETALQNSFIDWRLDLDKGSYIGVIYIDLRKAFETINKIMLINKLKNIGIGGKVLEWLKSYLLNRKQKVKFNDIFSELENVEHGVPQGSILGPLLFLIYINDVTAIFEGLKIKCKLFADDLMLYFSSKNISLIQNVLNEALKRLLKWLEKNQLKINIDKTVFTMIRDQRCKITDECIIKINDTRIKEVSETKYLGVIIDNNLNFDKNADYVAKKIAKKIGILSRLNYSVSSYTKSIIYKSIVSPHLDYCSTVMINYNQNKLNILQKLQNRAARVILGVNKYTAIKDMLEALGWLSVRQRMIYNTCIFIYKMVNGFAPDYLCGRVKIKCNESQYNTRNSSMIQVVSTRTKSAEKTITYVGYNTYNSLPNEVKDQITIPSFKRLLVHYIKNNIDIL